MELKDYDESFLFESNEEQQKEEMSFLNKKTKNQDGIYRPSLSDVTDQKVGYRAKIRFLRNLTRDGKVGPASIEKHQHYVAHGPFDSQSKLIGYYDCERNHKDKCELCTVYWKLKKSKNQADNERAELIDRNTKYYSYVMILEDIQQPKLVGKILVFPYGYTIKEKINGENTGEVSGNPCNVFDFANGKDFMLIIREKKTSNGTFPNYDSSQFLDVSPLKIYSPEKEKFFTVQLDENGEITDPVWQQKIKQALLSRDENVNVEDHKAKEDWTYEQRENVSKIISILNGEDIEYAESAVKQVRNTTPSIKKQPNSTSAVEDDFDFLFDKEDDEKS